MASPALKTVDYYNFSLLGADDSYLYGYRDQNGRNFLFRIAHGTDSHDASINNTTAVHDFGTEAIQGFFTTSVDGEIYAVVLETVGAAKAAGYRSTDHGETWTEVFRPGDIGTGSVNQIENVITEGNGCFCEAFVGSKRKLIFGEYNINGSRVAGSTNDQVRVIESIDNGVTWTNVTVLNTDGSTNQTRHIHTVVQDPYKKGILVAFGDQNTECGTVIWDGISAWPDNTELSDLASVDGFVVYWGEQRHRASTYLFTEDWVYSTSDATPLHADQGIWRFRRDGSSFERVNDDLTRMPGKIGWRGVQVGTNLFFTDYISSAPGSDYEITFWGADGDIGDFKKVARGGIRTDGTEGNFAAMNGFFVHGDKVYYSPQLTKAAGANDAACFVMELDGDFIDPEPTTVWPVWWVKADGVDETGATVGKYPSRAWASIQYALDGDKVTEGGLVILDADTYTESRVTPDFLARSKPGESGKPLTIRGEGKTKTTWIHQSSTIGMFFAAAHNIKLEKLWFYSIIDTCFQNSSSIAANITLIDARVGADVVTAPNAQRSVRNDNGIIRLYRSIIEAPFSSSSSRACIEADSASATTVIRLYEGSRLQGGFNSLELNGSAELYCYNSYILGAFAKAFRLEMAATTPVFEVRNSIVMTEGAGIYEDAGGVTTLPNFQNCLTSHDPSTSGMTPGEGHVISTVDPFVDQANGDLTLTAAASALLKTAGIKYWTGPAPVDVNGNPFSDFETSAGPVQAQDTPFHPLQL